MSASAIAKTKSALKRAGWWLVLVIMVASVGSVLFFTINQPVSQTLQTPAQKDYELSVVHETQPIKSRTYYLNPAINDRTRERGLGGRAGLAEDRGMLFIYPVMSTRCFWMKNMRFAIDIIWTDDTKKVTHVEKNVPPDSYPQQFCAEARYIIELNAGQADIAGIAEGQTLHF